MKRNEKSQQVLHVMMKRNKASLESWKEKRGRKGWKVYLKKYQLRTSKTWGEFWVSKFIKLIGHPTILIQNHLTPGTL